MRLLADLHISPSTVAFLRTLGHDVVRVDAILPNTASDEEIVVARALPRIEDDVARGSVITVEEGTVRSRTLPIE